MRLLTTFLLVLPLSLKATVFNLPDLALADVQAACAQAKDGDTIKLPAGSVTWNGQVQLSSAVDFEGAGTNQTFISEAGENTLIYVSYNNRAKLVTIGNMSLTCGGNAASSGNETIDVEGSCWIRIHNVNFTNGYAAIWFNFGGAGQRAYGCIDHCSFYNPDISISMNGNYSIWQDPIVAGDTNTMVIEDCYFKQDANANTSDDQEQIQSGHGIKQVVRHCVFDYTAFPSGTYCNPYEWHGLGNAQTSSTTPSVYAPLYTNNDNCLRGPPLIEIYQNTFNLGNRSGGRIFHDRGGSALIYSNVVNYSGSIALVQMTDDFATSGYQSIYGYTEFTTWAAIDQIENSYFWANIVNGNVSSDYGLMGDSLNLLPVLIQQGRDYFLAPPAGSGQGKVTWTDFPGGHQAVFTAGAGAYYPYHPLAYPHPLVNGSSNTNSPPPAPTGLHIINGSGTLAAINVQ